jgi:hypothetical protein
LPLRGRYRGSSRQIAPSWRPPTVARASGYPLCPRTRDVLALPTAGSPSTASTTIKSVDTTSSTILSPTRPCRARRCHRRCF